MKGRWSFIGPFGPTERRETSVLRGKVLPLRCGVEAIMSFKEQERWVVEGNIAKFEDKLKAAVEQKERDHLIALLARERTRQSRLPPED